MNKFAFTFLVLILSLYSFAQEENQLVCPDSVKVECIDEVPESLAFLSQIIFAGGSVYSTCDVNYSTFKLRAEKIERLESGITITRSYQVEDLCSTLLECTQVLIVKDKTAPTITCPEQLSISENKPVLETYKSYGDFEIAGGSSFDNCSLNFDSFHFDSETITTSGIYPTIHRNYVIEDSCGNEAACIQKIAIEDLSIANYIKENSAFETSVFPNPCKGRFTCVVNSISTNEISFKLINSEGRIIETRRIKPERNLHSEAFEILHANKGIYHLIISSKANKNTEIIVIQ